MEHEETPDEAPRGRRGHIPALCVSFIQKLQRATEKQPAKQNNKDAQNGALVGHTRSLQHATWVIAGVGILSFVAALLQWCALRSTDTATRDLATAALKQATAADNQVTAMQGQLSEMHQLAEAAKKSADVAEKTLLIIQRPIIAVERFEDFATVDPDKKIVTAWTFRAFIKNSGESTAVNGHNHINLAYRGTDLPDDFDYHDVQSKRPDAISIVTAKQENELLNFVIGIEYAMAIYGGDRKMFFYGWFEYDDTFEDTKRHRTEFAFKIGFPNDPRNPTFHKAMSFDVYGSRYNCIDKGCLYQPGHPPPQEPEASAPNVGFQ